MIFLFKKQLKCSTVRDIGKKKYLYEVDTLHALQHAVIPFLKNIDFFRQRKKKNLQFFKKLSVYLQLHQGHFLK